MYCSLFLSYINYCSEIWGNTCVTNIRCITVLQNRVVRQVCVAKRLEHTNTLFKQLRILKFVVLIKCKTATIMYKEYHNVLPKNLQNMFKLYVLNTWYSTERYLQKSSCAYQHNTNVHCSV